MYHKSDQASSLSPHNANVLESARSLVSYGLAVREVWPNSKRPADLRTHEEKLIDPSYNAVATTDINVLAERLIRATQSGQNMNLALYLRPTDRLIVVDADTSSAREKLTEVLGEEPTPTVLTPGVYDGQRWIHRDGAHYYYLLPEGFSKEGLSATETLVCSDGNKSNSVEVKIHSANAVTLPSVRPEGAYQLVTPPPFPDAPRRLLEILNERREIRSQVRVRQDSLDGVEAFDEWNVGISWHELLVEDGWTFAGTYDACGCAVYSRPGYCHGERSATAHEDGCLVTNSHILWAWSETASPRVNTVIERRSDGRRIVHKYELWREIYYSDDHLAAWVHSGLAALSKAHASSRETDLKTERNSTADSTASHQEIPSLHESRSVPFTSDHDQGSRKDLVFLDIGTILEDQRTLKAFVKKHRPLPRFICDHAFEGLDISGVRSVSDGNSFYGHKIFTDTPKPLKSFVRWCDHSLQRSWDDTLWLSEAHLWATLARSISEARVEHLSRLLGDLAGVEFFDEILRECASADRHYEYVVKECAMNPAHYEWPVWAGRLSEDREFLEMEVRERWGLPRL